MDGPSGGTGKLVAGILSGIVGVATLAVIFSRRSATSNVLQAAAQGFSSILSVAVSPVTGASGGAANVTPPNGGFGVSSSGYYGGTTQLASNGIYPGGQTTLAGNVLNVAANNGAFNGLINTGVNLGAKYIGRGANSLFASFEPGAGEATAPAAVSSFESGIIA